VVLAPTFGQFWLVERGDGKWGIHEDFYYSDIGLTCTGISGIENIGVIERELRELDEETFAERFTACKDQLLENLGDLEKIASLQTREEIEKMLEY